MTTYCPLCANKLRKRYDELYCPEGHYTRKEKI